MNGNITTANIPCSFRGRRRGGFVLIEALCSMVLLGTALAGFLASITYAFRCTTEARIRAENYAGEERLALTSMARNDPNVDDSNTFTKKIVELESVTSAGKDLKFNAIVWELPASPGRLRSGPSLVTILSRI